MRTRFVCLLLCLWLLASEPVIAFRLQRSAKAQRQLKQTQSATVAAAFRRALDSYRNQAKSLQESIAMQQASLLSEMERIDRCTPTELAALLKQAQVQIKQLEDCDHLKQILEDHLKKINELSISQTPPDPAQIEAVKAEQKKIEAEMNGSEEQAKATEVKNEAQGQKDSAKLAEDKAKQAEKVEEIVAKQVEATAATEKASEKVVEEEKKAVQQAEQQADVAKKAVDDAKEMVESQKQAVETAKKTAEAEKILVKEASQKAEEVANTNTAVDKPSPVQLEAGKDAEQAARAEVSHAQEAEMAAEKMVERAKEAEKLAETQATQSTTIAKAAETKVEEVKKAEEKSEEALHTNDKIKAVTEAEKQEVEKVKEVAKQEAEVHKEAAKESEKKADQLEVKAVKQAAAAAVNGVASTPADAAAAAVPAAKEEDDGLTDAERTADKAMEDNISRQKAALASVQAQIRHLKNVQNGLEDDEPAPATAPPANFVSPNSPAEKDLKVAEKMEEAKKLKERAQKTKEALESSTKAIKDQQKEFDDAEKHEMEIMMNGGEDPHAAEKKDDEDDELLMLSEEDKAAAASGAAAPAQGSNEKLSTQIESALQGLSHRHPLHDDHDVVAMEDAIESSKAVLKKYLSLREQITGQISQYKSFATDYYHAKFPLTEADHYTERAHNIWEGVRKVLSEPLHGKPLVLDTNPFKSASDLPPLPTLPAFLPASDIVNARYPNLIGRRFYTQPHQPEQPEEPIVHPMIKKVDNTPKPIVVMADAASELPSIPPPPEPVPIRFVPSSPTAAPRQQSQPLPVVPETKPSSLAPGAATRQPIMVNDLPPQ